jgi:hypothetical protein
MVWYLTDFRLTNAYTAIALEPVLIQQTLAFQLIVMESITVEFIHQSSSSLKAWLPQKYATCIPESSLLFDLIISKGHRIFKSTLHMKLDLVLPVLQLLVLDMFINFEAIGTTCPWLTTFYKSKY